MKYLIYDLLVFKFYSANIVETHVHVSGTKFIEVRTSFVSEATEIDNFT